MYSTSNFYLKSVTYVKTTPVAETIIKFYEIGHFSLKTTPFYRKLSPFYRKLNFWQSLQTQKPKGQKMFLTTNTKAMYLISNFYIKSVTYVKTTPAVETIIKFHEIAHFSLKTTTFYENYPFL